MCENALKLPLGGIRNAHGLLCFFLKVISGFMFLSIVTEHEKSAGYGLALFKPRKGLREIIGIIRLRVWRGKVMVRKIQNHMRSFFVRGIEVICLYTALFMCYLISKSQQIASLTKILHYGICALFDQILMHNKSATTRSQIFGSKKLIPKKTFGCNLNR